MLIRFFNMFFDKYVHDDFLTKQSNNMYMILSYYHQEGTLNFLNLLKMHKKYNTNMLKNSKIVVVCLQLQTLLYTYCSHNIVMQ
jgi:hypothetical protein